MPESSTPLSNRKEGLKCCLPTPITSKSKYPPCFSCLSLEEICWDPPQVNLKLPPITDEGIASVQPEKILDTRWIKQGEKFIEECLVKWK